MLTRFSERIVDWQIKQNRIQEEERAVYQYGYELLLNQTINILIAILIAAVFHAPVSVFLFLVCYIPLRSYCGGYHADTNLGCSVVSALLLVLTCLVSGSARYDWLAVYYPAAFLISGFFVIRYVPVADRNKPLDAEEQKRYRRKGILIWAVEVLAAAALYLLQSRLGLVIAVSHVILSFMLFLGLLKSQKIQSKSNM